MSISLFKSKFDDQIEKATYENTPIGSENITEWFHIADEIKSKSVNSKTAMKSIKNRLNHKNPNVQLLALKMTDICVKNSGHHFLVEIASEEFVDFLLGLVRAVSGVHLDVRRLVLEFIQIWGLSFKGKNDLRLMTQAYENLKSEGYVFPEVNEDQISSALIDTATAPEWTDSDVCTRCRQTFTTFVRKHHCRNCGHTYCQSCSSKQMSLPHFSINEEVRVCDGCFSKLSNKSVGLGSSSDVNADPLKRGGDPSKRNIVVESRLHSNASSFSSTDALAKKEADELAKAIQLSLKESETKSLDRPRSSTWKSSSQKVTFAESQNTSSYKARTEESEEDEDLKAAIEASLREMNLGAQKLNHNFDHPQDARIADESKLTPEEIQNIHLFVQLIGRMERDTAIYGPTVINVAALQAPFQKICELDKKLNNLLTETTAKYEQHIQLSQRLSDASKAYEQWLEQRLSGLSHPPSTVQTQSSYYVPNQMPVYQPYLPTSQPYTPAPPGEIHSVSTAHSFSTANAAEQLVSNTNIQSTSSSETQPSLSQSTSAPPQSFGTTTTLPFSAAPLHSTMHTAVSSSTAATQYGQTSSNAPLPSTVPSSNHQKSYNQPIPVPPLGPAAATNYPNQYSTIPEYTPSQLPPFDQTSYPPGYAPMAPPMIPPNTYVVTQSAQQHIQESQTQQSQLAEEKPLIEL